MSTLAVDPGNTTGVAIIGNSGELLREYLFSHDDFVNWLAAGGQVPGQYGMLQHVDLVVVEEFRLLPHKARAVSQTRTRELHASRGVGALELWTAMRGVELVKRDPRHWRIGLQLAGIPQSEWKSHSDGHAQVAYGAGFHYLVEAGMVQSRLPEMLR